MTMQPGWVPPGIDTGKANVARVYDWWLGGTHNFRADQDAARAMIAIEPNARGIARANRAFLGRAVRFLAAEAGIREEITGFFDGFSIVDPGLVWMPLWRPDHREGVPEHPERFWFLAGAGELGLRYRPPGAIPSCLPPVSLTENSLGGRSTI